MAYTNTLYHITFDGTISDAVGNTVTVTGTPVYVDGIFDEALSLEGVRLSSSALSMTNKLGVGFWLKSENPGMAFDPDDPADLYPLRMAVLMQGAVSLVSETFTANNTSLTIYEETLDTGQNKLVVILSGLDNSLSSVSYTIKSSPYDVGEYHHFFVNYDGSAVTPYAKLYIDAVEDTSATKTGTVPTVLTSTAPAITVNKIAPGYAFQVVENKGTIDDLVIFNAVRTLSEIRRIANMGALFVADTSYSNVEEIHQGFLFDDPSTIQVTSVFANRGNIYVGKTDGKLLRGVRSLWESRREFSDTRELNTLTVVSKTADNTFSVTDGVLKLKSAVIRI